MKMTKPFYTVREFHNLRELMDQSAQLYPDRYAFEVKNDKGEHYFITYKDYRNEINALGTALFDMGFKGGAHIAVSGENCYEWCLSYLATVLGSNVIVPIDKELSADDIYGIIEKAEVKLLFCDNKLLKKLDRERIKDVIIVNFRQKEDADGVLSLEKLVSKGRKLLSAGKKEFLEVPIDPEKMCTLLFTSGTTGTSKGVMLCQRNFCSDVALAMSVVKISPDDCGISMLPLHHTYESTIILFCAPYTGAKVTFCEGFKYVLRNMKEFSPSIFVSVPLILETVHRKLMKAVREKPHGEFKFKLGSVICKAAAKVGIDLKKVFFKEIQETFGGAMRLIICGAAPINPQILKDFDAFGIQIIFGYGLTECSPLVILNNDRLHLAESIGVPLPEVEAKIINPDEKGVGEICVRGPMVMLGYYQNEEATREVIDEDGFFHTGDLGRVDSKGRFYICGRSKNVIVTDNGKNIFPEELEYHLSLNHVIADSLVYGEEDKKGKLAVSAKIFPDYAEVKEVLGKDEVSDEEVEQVIKEAVDKTNSEVPSFKRITRFSIRKTEFIKTTTSKIQRFKKENLNDE
ncbi:MAG: AMP-binding protein [Clostridia bacterium]|nr:AMP-binding protein [Clostridia bacterium]